MPWPGLSSCPIGTIVYGYNGLSKRRIEFGKQFTQMSFVNRTGSTGRTRTSKESCLDPKQPYTGTFIYRGLYQFANAKILRKSKQNLSFGELCRGLLGEYRDMLSGVSKNLTRMSSGRGSRANMQKLY